jgi:hypothetical protein
MLYDNALFVWVLLEFYQIKPLDKIRASIVEILTYIQRDMMASEGGFYSAEDADSKGEEGTFYIWHGSELQEVLNTNEFDLISNI